MKDIFLLALMSLLTFQVHAQDCAPATPVITAGGATIICAGATVSLSTGSGNTWTQKEDFGGTVRYGAVGFSIGSKGYIGTGWNGVTRYKDFWEYDPVTDAWTQKANFGNATGPARTGAIGAGTTTKGYIGLGYDGVVFRTDFWEYDPVANTWTSRLAFPGTARAQAASFQLSGYIYVGTGEDAVGNTTDFYRFNPTNNTWLIRAPFPGAARRLATGFATFNRGYIGTGYSGLVNYADFYEYNPTLNSWATKSPYAGGAVRDAVGFAIGNIGYIGTGNISSSRVKTFWEYNSVTDVWIRRADFGGTARTSAVGFSIGGRGYVGTGNVGTATTDFWEYEPPVTLAWSTGATTSSILASDSGFYNVTATNSLGCVSSSLDVYIQTASPEAVIAPAGIINVCKGAAAITLTTPHAANNYNLKGNFPGLARSSSVGFNIGSKGYIGTGYGAGSVGMMKDFWEYNPVTDSWTQKADFAGTARQGAVGFAIGRKGYIGTGWSSIGTTKDFWEYNPTTNTWTQKEDFGGDARQKAVGFSIGGRGYIGTGTNYLNAGNPLATLYTDFWEYDPVTDKWTKKQDFSGVPRFSAVGFSIGTKGYLGTGFGTGSPPTNLNDFWEYDPQTNAWVRKADFNVQGLGDAVGFSIGGYGFIGTGWYYLGSGTASYSTMIRRYDPLSDTWLTSTVLPSSLASSGFSIGVRGYIIGGSEIGQTNRLNRVVEFDPGYQYAWSNGGVFYYKSVGTVNSSINTLTKTDILGCASTSVATIVNVSTPSSIITAAGPTTFCIGQDVTLNGKSNNEWTAKNDFGGNIRYQAAGFSIGTKGYIGTGTDGTTSYKDFWEYDPATNVWTQKSDFGGTARYAAVGLSIGGKGYIGTGGSSGSVDFWEYNPTSNSWTRKADFAGASRFWAVGFSIGTKGYVGTGLNGNKKDFWEYDPIKDSWQQKADFGGTGRFGAVGFSMGNKGYIGTGNDGVPKKDFWEYDPITNTWLRKADFGGIARWNAAGFNIANKGYLGTGFSGSVVTMDFWEYNPVSNAWVQKADLPSARSLVTGFGIGSKGYVGTGVNVSGTKDFYEYDPGYNYSWSSGQTTQAINVDSAGSFTVVHTDVFGCSATSSPTLVTVNTTNTWAGGGSSNWNTPTNWSCGIVPNHPKIDAVVLTSAVPMPILSSSVVVKSLTLSGSSTVDLNGQTLTINKNITGTGTLKGSATSSLTLKGATGIVRFTTGFNIIKDLLLTDTATATLSNALNIAAGASPGSVTVNANAVLNTNGNLTLKSDVNGTARVGILEGDILGDVTIERFINTGTAGSQHPKSWQFLATPTTGQTIRQAWQENGISPAGFGTIITGTGSGFDITTSLPSLKYYNAAANNWTAITNTNTALQNRLGYMLFVRGDRMVTTSAALPNNTNMRSKGALFTPLNPPPPVAVAANTFQTFGNPYASRISFSKVRLLSPGINDVFYVWDPKLNGYYGYGGYQTISGIAGYIPTVGTPPNGNSSSTFYPAGVPAPFIESGQAVFVKGNATGGLVNFDEYCKESGSRLVNRTYEFSNELANRQFIFTSLLTDNGLPADGNIVAFENGLGNELDEHDANKIFNAGENFGLSRSDSVLALEARNEIMDTDTIFYHMQNLQQQPYQLLIVPIQFSLNIQAYLVDRFTSSSTIISLSDSNFITFNITADPASASVDRFMLVLKKAIALPTRFIFVAAKKETNAAVAVRWKVDNETGILAYDIERSTDGRSFISIGQALPLVNNGTAAWYHFNDAQAPNGEVFYRIRATGQDSQIQYSTIVKVATMKSGEMSIFPNPVTHGTLYIQNNHEAGYYLVKIINQLGQVVYKGPIRLDKHATVLLSLNELKIPGNYQIVISGKDGYEFTEKLLVF